MTELYIALGALGIGVFWAVANYNALVRLTNHCNEAWSNVDTELKRRYNLIPNLVEAVKGYAEHEDQVMHQVTQARSNAINQTGAPQDQARQENVLVGSLKNLFAVAEGYPDLKASNNFLELQEELSNTEDRIQAARRFYNANVRDLNTRVEMFPSSVIANLFKFERKNYFEIESLDVREPVKANLSE